MQTRKQFILDALQFGPASGSGLATQLGAPEPSIRRTIGTLRAEGHDIRAMLDGTYRLFPDTTAPSQRMADTSASV